ncbi:MAG TPA: MFS transporter [Bacillales bacterium]|nr:MFS transporter [Bacillales bacterium]
MFRTLHPNIRIRIYTSFLSRTIGSMIFPFMAIYFTEALGASWASTLLMANVVIQFTASLYGGYLADQRGRKKMMVAGEFVKTIGFFGILIANSPWWHSPWFTFAMITLLGISSGMVNPASEAMLIDVSTKKTRAFMYSINYWAVNMSIMIGLIVGGWLFQTHFFELLIALCAMSLVTFWITSAFITETFVPGKKTTGAYGIKPIFQSYRTVIGDLPFVLFTLGGIALLSLEFQRNNFIAVRLEEEIIPKTYSFFANIHVTIDGVKLLSLLTIENTIIIVLFTAAVAKWLTGRKRRPLLYAGFLLFGSGYAILAFSDHWLLLFFGVILLSVGELLYVPTRQSLLADIIDDSRRGAYMAFNGFVFQIGKLFGALGILAGEVIGGYGMGIAYIGFACLAVTFVHMALAKRFHQKVAAPVKENALSTKG